MVLTWYNLGTERTIYKNATYKTHLKWLKIKTKSSHSQTASLLISTFYIFLQSYVQSGMWCGQQKKPKNNWAKNWDRVWNKWRSLCVCHQLCSNHSKKSKQLNPAFLKHWRNIKKRRGRRRITSLYNSPYSSPLVEVNI